MHTAGCMPVFIIPVAQRSSTGGLVHEPPLHKLQQTMSNVPTKSSHFASGQPGLPRRAQMAPRLVPQGLRLLSKVLGRTRQRTETTTGQLGLSVFLTKIRIRSGTLVQPSASLTESAVTSRHFIPFFIRAVRGPNIDNERKGSFKIQSQILTNKTVLS